MKEKMVDLGDLIKGGHRLPRWLLNWGEKRLGLHALNVAHAHIEEDWDAGSQETFFHLACRYLHLCYDLTGLENIPAEGSCVIVSNHPHGMSDGLMFGDVAMRVRKDIRIVVNEFLHCVRGMRPYEITVDVYGGDAAKRANMAGMREMLRWLKEGHCVLVFPSGSVASWSGRDRRVIDDPWQDNMAAVIRRTGATVVPMHISGHTGVFFQLMTVLAKGLRPNFLTREILRDGRMRHSIRIGKPIAPSTIALVEGDHALSDYLRLCSMLLRYPEASDAPSKQAAPASASPATEPDESHPAEALRREVESLPDEALCYAHEGNGLCVYAATAGQIPTLLHEIGVQRERTFRAVGEGTGTACDLDAYDPHYVHLIMWDSKAHRLAGAYRMGRTDLILKDKGLKGLYNATFFRFSPSVLSLLSQGLEMGRAFITPDYQRLPASLDTLWMGIGRYLNKHPEYRYLYGTVSISGDYTRRSRSLILSWLKACQMNSELSRQVQALYPPKGLDLLSEDARLLPSALADLRLLNGLVSDMEPDARGIPVLLRQYLRLGGKMLSFGVDESFGGTLDCLVLVDLREAPERVIRRYRGREHVRASASEASAGSLTKTNVSGTMSGNER